MDRFKKARLASVLGIIGNIFLLIIKGVVGFITNSQAMIADFFNSLGDVLSSILTYVGNKIASKPRDDDHDLGHGKAEYIYSMLISIAMMLMSFEVIISSFKSLIIKNNYRFSKWLIVVCIVTIIVKFLLYLYTNSVSKKYNNLLIEANSKDHRNDCIITLLTLLSAILCFYKVKYVDGVIGIILGAWILLTGIKIFIKSYDVLMDKTISKSTRNEVLKIVDKYKEIEKVNHFNATPVGYKYQISLTIFVDGNISTYESHKIADNLEKDIVKNIPEIYLAVIHVNPIDVDK